MAAPTIALLAMVAVYGATLELMARRVFDPSSKQQQRLAREMRQAFLLRPASGHPKHLLIVGNSLLESAVEMRELESHIRPGWQAARFFVSDTTYNDWRFGLKRLLDSGARPDAIAVMLSPRQLVAERVHGNYFAHYLMRPSDLPRVAEAAHLHRTEAADLLLAHYSLYYAISAQLRNVVLGACFSGLPDLLFNVAHQTQPRIDDEAVARKSAERLRELSRIASAHGAQFVLLLPPLPTDSIQESDAPVVSSGRTVGVAVLNPVPIGELPSSAFRDGLHANPEGAAEYTRRLAPMLRDWLEIAGRPAALQPRPLREILGNVTAPQPGRVECHPGGSSWSTKGAC